MKKTNYNEIESKKLSLHILDHPVFDAFQHVVSATLTLHCHAEVSKKKISMNQAKWEKVK